MRSTLSRYLQEKEAYKEKFVRYETKTYEPLFVSFAKALKNNVGLQETGMERGPQKGFPHRRGRSGVPNGLRGTTAREDLHEPELRER